MRYSKAFFNTAAARGLGLSTLMAALLFLLPASPSAQVAGGEPLERVAADLTLKAEPVKRSLQFATRTVLCLARDRKKELAAFIMEIDAHEEFEKSEAGHFVFLKVGKVNFTSKQMGAPLERSGLAAQTLTQERHKFEIDPTGQVLLRTFVALRSWSPFLAMESFDMGTDLGMTYQALSLRMPNRRVSAGEAWDTIITVVGRSRKESVEICLNCVYEGSRTRQGRTEALIKLSGEVKPLQISKKPAFRPIRDVASGVAAFDVGAGMLVQFQLKLETEFDYEGIALARTIDLVLRRGP